GHKRLEDGADFSQGLTGRGREPGSTGPRSCHTPLLVWEHQFGMALRAVPLEVRRAREVRRDMCERLGSLRKGMQQFVRGLDAALLSADDAGRALADATAIEHMAATAKALLAARVAECGRTRAAHTDREELRAKHRRERYVRTWTDEEGAGHVHAKGPADDVARIMARVNAERDKIFRQAHAEGREEPAEAYSFDALV